MKWSSSLVFWIQSNFIWFNWIYSYWNAGSQIFMAAEERASSLLSWVRTYPTTLFYLWQVISVKYVSSLHFITPHSITLLLFFYLSTFIACFPLSSSPPSLPSSLFLPPTIRHLLSLPTASPTLTHLHSHTLSITLKLTITASPSPSILHRHPMPSAIHLRWVHERHPSHHPPSPPRIHGLLGRRPEQHYHLGRGRWLGRRSIDQGQQQGTVHKLFKLKFEMWCPFLNSAFVKALARMFSMVFYAFEVKYIWFEEHKLCTSQMWYDVTRFLSHFLTFPLRVFDDRHSAQ